MGQAKQRGSYIERQKKAVELKESERARKAEEDRLAEMNMTPRQRKRRTQHRVMMAAYLGMAAGFGGDR